MTYTAQTYKRKLLEINFIDYAENSTVFRNNINEMVSVTVMFVLEIPHRRLKFASVGEV